ncbi:metallophosphoesterase [Duganella sp. CF517]|uniref:metallophosphoesterase family protein n=1 Tax=Duganella sp. CF517 TaxID=1881038 RepID=UPI0015A5A017|nr:metallophosphoesterase [Duganella sp. CF517]
MGLFGSLSRSSIWLALLCLGVSALFIFRNWHHIKGLVGDLLNIIERMVAVIISLDYGLRENLSMRIIWATFGILLALFAGAFGCLWPVLEEMWNSTGIFSLLLRIAVWLFGPLFSLMLGLGVVGLIRQGQNPLKPSMLALSTLSPQQAACHVHVAHLSDLHIPRDTRLTEDEPWEPGILDKCRNALAENDENTPLAAIVCSGDITDTGHPDAWKKFVTSFGAYKGRIVMGPGNHDLNIVGYGALSILLVGDKFGTAGRWVRMVAFMKTAIEMMDDRAQVWQHGKLVPLADAWETISADTSNERKALQAANDLFPFVVTVEKNQALTFIVWNTVRSSSLAFNNSFGNIGKKQLNNFQAINEHFKQTGMSLLHVMHHKIGLPKARFKRQKTVTGTRTYRLRMYLRDSLQLAGMTMANARTVLPAILQNQSTVVLHGHHHATFTGEYALGGKVMQVVSAPSSTLGTEYHVGTDGRPRKGFDILELGRNDMGWALMRQPIQIDYKV